jgi:hypothetical protein
MVAELLLLVMMIKMIIMIVPAAILTRSSTSFYARIENPALTPSLSQLCRASTRNRAQNILRGAGRAAAWHRRRRGGD